METTKLLPRWRNYVAAVSLMLAAQATNAQSQATLYCGPVLPHTFYDELVAAEGAFTTEGTGTTVIFTTEAATPDYVNGRIMTGTELLNFVTQHQLAVDNGANSVLYDETRDVIINGQEYSETYSYGVERKTFDHVTIDGEEHENVFCLQVVELLSISNETYTEPAEIENTYFVLCDAAQNVISVFGYNEVFTDATVFYQKYSMQPVAGQALKMASASGNKQFTIHPNPATSSVTINFMLPEEDDAVIIIRDLAGKKVKENNIGKVAKEEKRTHTEDISTLPAGVYTVSLTTTRSIQTLKLTVE